MCLPEHHPLLHGSSQGARVAGVAGVASTGAARRDSGKKKDQADSSHPEFCLVLFFHDTPPKPLGEAGGEAWLFLLFFGA